MNESLNIISLPRLAIGFLPALVAIGIMFWWTLDARTGVYATVRMLIQLSIVGYFLTAIFATDQSTIVALVLVVMLCVACWISLRPVTKRQATLYVHAFIAVSVGGVSTLVLVIGFVLQVEPYLRRATPEG